MNIRLVLLAGCVLPFGLSAPSQAIERNLQPFVLAQAEEACAVGDAECLEREAQRQAIADGVCAADDADCLEAVAEAAAEEPAAEAPAEEVTAPAETDSQDPAEAEAVIEEPAAAEEDSTEAEAVIEEAAPAEEAEVVVEETAPVEEAPPEAPAARTRATRAAEEPAAEPEATQEVTREERQRARQERRRLQAAEEAQETAAPEAPVVREAAPKATVLPVPEEAAAPKRRAPAEAETIAAPTDAVVEPDEVKELSREERQRLREERRRQRAARAAEENTAPAATEAPAGQPAQAPATRRAAAPAADESVVQQQLEDQGSEEQIQQFRQLRRKLREERRETREIEPNRRRGEQVERRGDRDIVRFGGQIIIRPSENTESERLLYGATDVQVEELGNGFTQTTVFRENGSRIITVRNEYGEIVTRVRRTRNGREIVLIDNRYPDGPPPVVVFERELPPLVVQIPREQYIVETRRADEGAIAQALAAAPVERVERAYTLEEVRRSERLRDKVRRVDLDTITFDTGSAVVKYDQLDALDKVGTAIEEVLAENPEEVILIEGHTDAVGSDESNLVLSDRRAEAVAVALSQDFAIPPENLVTQGYGEEFLKVPTEAAERENRRVTIRNISGLLTAANQ